MEGGVGTNIALWAEVRALGGVNSALREPNACSEEVVFEQGGWKVHR